jgi:choice-of-anchor B domain-containing protein
VYRFAWDEAAGEWNTVSKLAGADGRRGRAFAGALAAGGTVAVVGARGDDYGAGTAVVFERSGDGAWTDAGKLASELVALAPIAGREVECRDGKAADLFGCRGMAVQSFLPVQGIGGRRGVEVNDLWGWTDPETGREYALVGRSDGTSFIDVTDPLRPVYLGDLPMTDSANGSSWRDIKVYRDHAFIVSDGAGPHGMQVFDLTELRRVRTPPVTFRETAHYSRINSAHNIVINEATGFAYPVGASGGGETCGGGLHMVDIRDPRNPTFAGCFQHAATGRAGTGYTHDAQCVTYQGPDREHRGREICLGSNETALSIADVTDKSSPRPLASASYPNVAYAHQGWLTEDQRYFYMDDEGDELSGTVTGTRTLIWDVADLDDPVLLGEYVSENQASDHNLYIRDNLMYQSNYVAGLRVLDISDPARPVPVGHFDTVPWGEDQPGFDGSWSNYPFFKSGIVVVTSGREGVFVLRRRPETLVP